MSQIIAVTVNGNRTVSELPCLKTQAVDLLIEIADLRRVGAVGSLEQRTDGM